MIILISTVVLAVLFAVFVLAAMFGAFDHLPH